MHPTSTFGPNHAVSTLDSAEPNPRQRRGIHIVALVIIGSLALVVLGLVSMFVGSGNISLDQVIAAFTNPQNDAATMIVRDYRLPRTLLAVLIGIALGVAGGTMQALTRNPLADPGLLGVNAGAYTAVVFAAAVWGSTLTFAHVGVALCGALLTAAIVYTIGSTGISAASPSRLVLTGVALGALLNGVSFAVTLLFPTVFDRVRFWNAGSIQGRTFNDLLAVLPIIAIGLALALALPAALNTLALGDEAATALGARPNYIRLVGLLSITLLCGGATAVAGPVSFIGLMVPHAVRALVGPDWRRIIPLCVLAAPILTLGADILGRLVVASELPLGVVTAFLGAPLLIALVRVGRTRSL